MLTRIPEVGEYIRLLRNNAHGTTELKGAILKVVEREGRIVKVSMTEEAMKCLTPGGHLQRRGWWYFGYEINDPSAEIYVQHTRKRKSLIK